MAVTSVFFGKHGDFWSWGVSKSTLIISVTGLPSATGYAWSKPGVFLQLASVAENSRGGGGPAGIFDPRDVKFDTFWHTSFWWFHHPHDEHSLWSVKFWKPHATKSCSPLRDWCESLKGKTPPITFVHQKYPPPPERNSMSLLTINCRYKTD